MSTVFKSRTPHGGWTTALNLGHEYTSYEDMISPEFFELEREAIFRPSWLYIGRTDRIPAPGSYFTKEIDILKASVLVTRDRTKGVRVYYNVCPHRGNKLVWDTQADREVSGRCSTFFCKFHGIQFATDGTVAVLTERDAWLDGQGDKLHLAEIPFEIWNGFIFINLNWGGPKESLREFLGEHMWKGFDGYPFDTLTEKYFFRATAKANWKAMIDGFSEVYHAPATHALTFKVAPSEMVVMPANHFGLHGKHRTMVYEAFPTEHYNFEYERATEAFGTGPRYKAFPKELHNLPPAANPNGLDNWGNSTTKIWPHMDIQFYNPGWFLTYANWPLAYDRMRFEVEIYLPKPKNFSEMLSQQASMFMFMDAALQDFSMIEATQQGLENRAFTQYPLADHELLVRSFHQHVYATVEQYKRDRAGCLANSKAR